MPVFGDYSAYYNLLNKDKDYAGEAEYLHGLIARYQPEARTLLDLGCGTGKHDLLLAKMGYEVTGVDRSAEMIAIANAQFSSDNPPPASIHFTRGDIRTIRLGKTYDIVTSLFHVMSYQTGNNDLSAAFATVSAHLKPGGIFIFDCWYGPAVLTDRPTMRVKRLEDEAISVLRIAEPVMHPNENLVDVNYHVVVRDRKGATVEEIRETHRMRYLFRPELELLLGEAGLRIIGASEWMSDRQPGFDTWGACFVVRG